MWPLDTEIQGCSVINGRGRAPLIVVPDTGTRPQTKQDRAGAGCHAQSPSSGKPVRCSGGLDQTEVTGYRAITGESSERCREVWECSRFGKLLGKRFSGENKENKLQTMI